MSSRQFRKKVGNPSLPPPEDDSEEEYQPQYANQKSLFAGFLVNSETESEHSSHHSAEEEEQEDEAEQQAVAGALPRTNQNKNKKQKNKGKGKGKGKSTQPEVEMEDLDLTLAEVNFILGDLEPSLGSPANAEELQDVPVLRLEPKHLRVDNELGRLLGPEEHEPGERQNKQPPGYSLMLKRILIWPNKRTELFNFKNAGITMTKYNEEGGILYFHFNHDEKYQKMHRNFLYMYGNVNKAGSVTSLISYFNVAREKMHVEALLEISDLWFELEDNYDGALRIANEIVENVVTFLQSRSHPEFRSLSGNVRLEYKYLENRPFHVALLKYVYLLSNKACHRTALEIIKVMLIIDPQDPLAVISIVDTVAIRAREFEWLIEFIEFFDEKQDALLLYNLRYSYALAHYHVAIKNKKSLAAADEHLQNAIVAFPALVVELIKASSVPVPTSISKHKLFAKDPEIPGSRGVQELHSIFIKLNWPRWREAKILDWVLKNAERVREKFDHDPEFRTKADGYRIWRRGDFQVWPAEYLRHMAVLSRISKLVLDSNIEFTHPRCGWDPIFDPGVNRYNYKYHEKAPRDVSISDGYSLYSYDRREELQVGLYHQAQYPTARGSYYELLGEQLDAWHIEHTLPSDDFVSHDFREQTPRYQRSRGNNRRPRNYQPSRNNRPPLSDNNGLLSDIPPQLLSNERGATGLNEREGRTQPSKGNSQSPSNMAGQNERERQNPQQQTRNQPESTNIRQNEREAHHRQSTDNNKPASSNTLLASSDSHTRPPSQTSQPATSYPQHYKASSQTAVRSFQRSTRNNKPSPRNALVRQFTNKIQQPLSNTEPSTSNQQPATGLSSSVSQPTKPTHHSSDSNQQTTSNKRQTTLNNEIAQINEKQSPDTNQQTSTKTQSSAGNIQIAQIEAHLLAVSANQTESNHTQSTPITSQQLGGNQLTVTKPQPSASNQTALQKNQQSVTSQQMKQNIQQWTENTRIAPQSAQQLKGNNQETANIQLSAGNKELESPVTQLSKNNLQQPSQINQRSVYSQGALQNNLQSMASSEFGSRLPQPIYNVQDSLNRPQWMPYNVLDLTSPLSTNAEVDRRMSFHGENQRTVPFNQHAPADNQHGLYNYQPRFNSQPLMINVSQATSISQQHIFNNQTMSPNIRQTAPMNQQQTLNNQTLSIDIQQATYNLQSSIAPPVSTNIGQLQMPTNQLPSIDLRQATQNNQRQMLSNYQYPFNNLQSLPNNQQPMSNTLRGTLLNNKLQSVYDDLQPATNKLQSESNNADFFARRPMFNTLQPVSNTSQSQLNNQRMMPNTMEPLPNDFQPLYNNLHTVPVSMHSVPNSMQPLLPNHFQVLPNGQLVPNNLQSLQIFPMNLPLQSSQQSSPNNYHHLPSYVQAGPNNLQPLNNIQPIYNNMQPMQNNVSVPNNLQLLTNNLHPGHNNLQLITNNLQPISNNLQPLQNNYQLLPNNLQPVPNNLQAQTNDRQPQFKNMDLTLNNSVYNNMPLMMSNQQPFTYNPQAAMRYQEPARHSQQPASNNQKPARNSQQLARNSQEPTLHNQQPAMSSQEPARNNPKSATNNTNSSEQPMAAGSKTSPSTATDDKEDKKPEPPYTRETTFADYEYYLEHDYVGSDDDYDEIYENWHYEDQYGRYEPFI